MATYACSNDLNPPMMATPEASMSSQPAAGLHSDFADSEGTFSSNLEQSSGSQEPIHLNNSILTNFAQKGAPLNLCGLSAVHNQVRAPISHSHFVGLSQSNRAVAPIQVESSNPTPHGSASAFSRQLAVPSSLPSGSDILARLAQQRAALRQVFEPQPPSDDPAEVPVRMLPNGLVDIVPRLPSQSMAAHPPSIYAAATLTPAFSLLPKRKHRAPRTHRPGPKLKLRPIGSATSEDPVADGVPKVKCGSVHNGSVHALDALAINDTSIVQSVEKGEYANLQINQSPSRSYSSTPLSNCETGSLSSVATDEVRCGARTQSPSCASTPSTSEASSLPAVCLKSYGTVGCAEHYDHQSPRPQSSCARPSGCSSSSSNSSTNPNLVINSCDDVHARHGGHPLMIRDSYAQRHQSPVLNFAKQNDLTESRASQESDPPKRDTSTMEKKNHKSAASHLSSLPNAQLFNTNNTAHLSLTHSNYTQILSPLITSNPQTPPSQIQHSENQNCSKAQGSMAFQADPFSVCPSSAMHIQYCAQTPRSQVQRPGNQHLNGYSIGQGQMEFQSHPSSAFSSPAMHQHPQTPHVPNNLHNSMMRQQLPTINPAIQGNQSMHNPVPSHHVQNGSQNHMTRQHSSAVKPTMQTTQSMHWYTPNNFIPQQSSAFNPAMQTTHSMHQHTPNSMMLPQFQAANLAMQPTQSMHQHTPNSTMPQQSSVEIVGLTGEELIASSQAPPMRPQLSSPDIVDLANDEPIASTQAPPMRYMLRFDPIRSAMDQDHRQFWHLIHGTTDERRGLSFETRGLSLPLSLWIEREQETGKFEPTSRIYCPGVVDEFTTQPATTKTWQEFLDWFQENRCPKPGSNRGGSRKRQHAGNNETSQAEPSNKRPKNTPAKRRHPLQNTTHATQTNQQITQFGNQMIAQIVQPQFQNIFQNASQLAVTAAAPVPFNPTIQNPAQLAFAATAPVPVNPTIQNPAQPAVAAATLVFLNPIIPNAAELAVSAAAPVSLSHVNRAIELPPPTLQPIEPTSRLASPPEPEVNEYGWTLDESSQFEEDLQQAMKLQEEEDNRKIFEKERLDEAHKEEATEQRKEKDRLQKERWEEARKKAIEQQEEEDRREKERSRLKKERQATVQKEQIKSEKRIKEFQAKKREAKLAQWADEQAREAARDQSWKEEAARTKAEEEAKKAEKEAKEAARIEAEKKEKARVEAEKAAKEKLCLDCQKKAEELDELQKRIAKLKKDKPTLKNPLLKARLDKEISLAQEKVKALVEWAGLTIQEDGKIGGDWVCGHLEGDDDNESEGDQSYWSIEEEPK